MKFLDKLILKIFSIIILIVTVGLILIMLDILPIDTVMDTFIEYTDDLNEWKIAISVIVVLIALSIKGIFFGAKPENNGKDGIVLENDSGTLVISKESLENLIASVTKEIPGAETISSKTIIDRDKNLIVYVTAIVSKDVMIKEVSQELQKRVKEAMKKTADLEVNEVNIKIKNITSKKVKGLPAPKEIIVENPTNTLGTVDVDYKNTENANIIQDDNEKI